MVIRPQQMEAFSHSGKETAIRSICQSFAVHFPSLTLDSAWERRLRSNLQRAESLYGLSTLRDLDAFASLCGGLGWEFDTLPPNHWMAACLRNPAITRPSDRMTVLLRTLEQNRATNAHNHSLRESFKNR